MAWGISPRKTAVVSLGDYSADHYLTLLYHAMESMGWHISYFDHDGIIAYTNISWASYSEEISARIKGDKVFIKSECVGYQGLFTDYGKNKENLDLLFGELDVRNVLLQDNMEVTAQELMDTIPEKQFVQLDNPPMGGKELLHSFWTCFKPQKGYFITPLLVLVNISFYIISMVALVFTLAFAITSHHVNHDLLTNSYLLLGFSGRSQVLHGEVWRLLTNTFLHFNLLHITGNMIVLIYIGSMIESKIGRWNFLCLYLCTGIASSMVSVMWRDEAISAGASGAIFGLFGILLALLSTDFYERSARRAILISTAIFVAYSIIPIGRHVDHAAHFGGLISGYIFGLIAYWGLKKQRNTNNSGWLVSFVSITAMLLFVWTGLSFTTDYKTKEYQELVQKSHAVNTDLNGFFYNSADTSRAEKLKTLTTYAIPEIKQYDKMADQMLKMALPAKDRKEAQFRAQIIKLQCKYFQLLYLEFKEHTPKYRPQITASTDAINKIRMEWGKAIATN